MGYVNLFNGKTVVRYLANQARALEVAGERVGDGRTVVAVVVAVGVRGAEVGVVRSGRVAGAARLRVVRLLMVVVMVMRVVVTVVISTATDRRHVARRHRPRLHALHTSTHSAHRL